MITVNELAAKVLEMCKAKGWSLHWTARGCYLHLEASELIESIRGKGDSSVTSEAADVLIVLMSITENHGLKFSDVVLQAQQTVQNLLDAEFRKHCKNCLGFMPSNGADICDECAAEIAGAKVRCSKCGKVPREWPRQKYCGDGRDKDNDHDWQPIQPKLSGEVDPPPSSIVDQDRVNQIMGKAQ